MVAKGVEVVICWGLGRRQLIIPLGPHVSHGVILCGFEGRPIGSFQLHGSGSEIQLRSRRYL